MAVGANTALRLGRLLFLYMEGRQVDWKGWPRLLLKILIMLTSMNVMNV